MLSNYFNFEFDVHGKPVNGFCLRIHDDFHETYAVVVEGYHSFCVWLDGSSTWHISKNAILEKSIVERIITKLSSDKLAL